MFDLKIEEDEVEMYKNVYALCTDILRNLELVFKELILH